MDPDNPYNLMALVPRSLADAIQNLEPKFLGLSEGELRALAKPSAEVSRLRLNFWDEYERAVSQQRGMRLDSIMKGVCNKAYFYEKILHNQKWLAYVTIPPADYSLAIREMLELGWDRVREVLLLPITEKVSVKKTVENPLTGKYEVQYEIEDRPNTRLIGEINKMVSMLDLRVKGAIVQKMQIDQRNLNYNVDGTVQESSPFLADATMGQLDAMEKKIARLRGEMESLENVSPKETVLALEESSEDSDLTILALKELDAN